MDSPFSFHNIDLTYKQAVEKLQARQIELATKLCERTLRRILENPLSYPPDQDGARAVVCEDYDDLTDDGRLAFQLAFGTYGWRVNAITCSTGYDGEDLYSVILTSNAGK
jgi:hypothetical protein